MYDTAIKRKSSRLPEVLQDSTVRVTEEDGQKLGYETRNRRRVNRQKCEEV